MQKNTGKTTKSGEFPRSIPFEAWHIPGLQNKKEAAGYLEACLEQSDEPRLFPLALQDVIKANGGFSEVARKIGMQPEALSRAVSLKTTPKIHVVRAILNAIGIDITLTPHQAPRPDEKKKAVQSASRAKARP